MRKPTLSRADGRIDLHGRTVAYRTWPGTGVPALMLHGVGLSMRSWGSIPDSLAASGVPVIAIDLPGHGMSSGGSGDYSVPAFAVTVRDLLDHLRVPRVDLIGHSLGGGVALSFAFLFPERSRRLVLVAAGGLGWEANAALRMACLPGAQLALRVALTGSSLACARAVGRRLAAVGLHPGMLDPETLDTAAGLTDADRRAAFLATIRSSVGVAGQSLSALDHLARIDGQDVLIVWGDRDPVLPPAHGRAAHSLLPGSRLEIFAGAGHDPHRFDPVTFTNLVREHLRPSSPPFLSRLRT